MRNLTDMLEDIEKRKIELGIVDTPESIEAMRNKGGSRTPEKQELLLRIKNRLALK